MTLRRFLRLHLASFHESFIKEEPNRGILRQHCPAFQVLPTVKRGDLFVLDWGLATVLLHKSCSLTYTHFDNILCVSFCTPFMIETSFGSFCTEGRDADGKLWQIGADRVDRVWLFTTQEAAIAGMESMIRSGRCFDKPFRARGLIRRSPLVCCASIRTVSLSGTRMCMTPGS
jgi:hypothetical protein